MSAKQEPQVVRQKLLGIQVCVPKSWTNKKVQDFANRSVPSGTSGGWKVVKKHDNGDKARVACASKERDNFVHIILEP